MGTCGQRAIRRAGELIVAIHPPTASDLASRPATSSSPGAAPHWPPTTNDMSLDTMASGVVPAFVANAASIAPGTDKAAVYPIESTRAVDDASALTVATTSLTARGCNICISCTALSLGHVVSVVNGGPAAGTLGTFAASMTKAEFMWLWWDGTNFIFNGQDWGNP